MEEEWTCGKGLAANSALPADMASFFTAMATVLELHTRSLDLSESSGRAEHDAYTGLVAQQRAIASSLEALSHDMAGYVDLPMATHDMQLLSAPESTAAFQQLVTAETILLERLRRTAEEHGQMLSD